MAMNGQPAYCTMNVALPDEVPRASQQNFVSRRASSASDSEVCWRRGHSLATARLPTRFCSSLGLGDPCVHTMRLSMFAPASSSRHPGLGEAWRGRALKIEISLRGCSDRATRGSAAAECSSRVSAGCTVTLHLAAAPRRHSSLHSNHNYRRCQHAGAVESTRQVQHQSSSWLRHGCASWCSLPSIHATRGLSWCQVRCYPCEPLACRRRAMHSANRGSPMHVALLTGQGHAHSH